MPAIFHAHSGLRFLILLLGAVNLVVFGVGLLRKQRFEKMHRILGSSFVGFMHLQVLIGFAMVAMGKWYPALIGHIAMMSIATVVAQVAMTVNKKRPTPGFQLPLLGTALALVCIFGGVMAIGRGLFTMTVAG